MIWCTAGPDPVTESSKNYGCCKRLSSNSKQMNNNYNPSTFFFSPGCKSDDEDECPSLPENGSGDDDLITPVYVPPTRQPVTKAPKKTAPSGGKPNCDDEEEDCFPGSGSGEPTEETTVGSHRTGKRCADFIRVIK